MLNLDKPWNNLSHSFLVRPDVHFEIQRPDESVILVIRKHVMTQFSWIFNSIILIVIIVLANFLLPRFLAPNQIIVFNLFGFIFTFSYAWLNFLLWYFSVGIVTNQRILDLDFYNVIYKEFTATTIEKISDLTNKVGGFFGSIFDFGDVFVKTEGFEQNIEFEDVPDPSGIVKIINELKVNTPGG